MSAAVLHVESPLGVISDFYPLLHGAHRLWDSRSRQRPRHDTEKLFFLFLYHI